MTKIDTQLSPLASAIFLSVSEWLLFNAKWAIAQLYHGDQLIIVEEAGVPGENHQPWASNW
jgi:hypothetical protein